MCCFWHLCWHSCAYAEPILIVQRYLVIWALCVGKYQVLFILRVTSCAAYFRNTYCTGNKCLPETRAACLRYPCLAGKTEQARWWRWRIAGNFAAAGWGISWSKQKKHCHFCCGLYLKNSNRTQISWKNRNSYL
jgi:hypothetical protein